MLSPIAKFQVFHKQKVKVGNKGGAQTKSSNLELNSQTFPTQFDVPGQMQTSGKILEINRRAKYQPIIHNQKALDVAYFDLFSSILPPSKAASWLPKVQGNTIKLLRYACIMEFSGQVEISSTVTKAL